MTLLQFTHQAFSLRRIAFQCALRTKVIFSSNFTQSLLSLILIVGLLGKIFFFYDGLGRRIQTKSQGNTINYYYDPEIEFLALGNNINGSQFWNLYGPDRSGIYGGAQGIGGLECTYNPKSVNGKEVKKLEVIYSMRNA